MNYLRLATASQSRILGPFIDDTDFKTAATGLTIANTDIKLSANGAASANKNSGGGTHRVNGRYSVTFDATDTGTLGELDVSVKVAGALQVFKTFHVVTHPVYDNLFYSSGILLGTAATGTLSTTVITTDLSGYANDQLIGRVLVWLSGDCEGEATRITDYASSGGTLTVVPLISTPANGDRFKIV